MMDACQASAMPIPLSSSWPSIRSLGECPPRWSTTRRPVFDDCSTERGAYCMLKGQHLTCRWPRRRAGLRKPPRVKQGTEGRMTMQEYVVALQELSLKQDLSSSRAAPVIAEQLRQQGRCYASSYRYAVAVEITEGSKRPFRDIDNYTKRILDAITRTRLLWYDDEQIDRLNVNRRRDKVGLNLTLTFG